MNDFSNLGKERSGARLSGKLYREWHRKVQRHDKMEILLGKIVKALDESDIDWGTDVPKELDALHEEARALVAVQPAPKQEKL